MSRGPNPGGLRKPNHTGGVKPYALADGEQRFKVTYGSVHVGTFTSRAEAEAAREKYRLSIAESPDPDPKVSGRLKTVVTHLRAGLNSYALCGRPVHGMVCVPLTAEQPADGVCRNCVKAWHRHSSEVEP